MRIWALAVGLLFIMNVNGYAAAQRPSYDRLEKLFLEGQFGAAASESDALIKAGYGPKDEIYYLKGLSELKLNKFDEARESFQYIVSKYPGSRKAFDANLGVGDSYMLAGKLSDAVGIYIGMLDNFRQDKNLPVLYSRLASCYKGLGVKDKAEYYKNMAQQAAPLSFEAKGQVAVVQARAIVPSAQVDVAQPRAVAPKVSGPVTNISPKDHEDMDVVLATDKAMSVQVGSFKNRRNAEKLAKKLAASEYDSRIEIPVADGEKLYRVKVGRVSSKAEAEALKARLAADGYNTKICDGETCE